MVANKKRIEQLRQQLINAFGQMCYTAHADYGKYNAFALFFQIFYQLLINPVGGRSRNAFEKQKHANEYLIPAQ